MNKPQDTDTHRAHGWQSACDPLTSEWTYATFSVSFYRLVPKAGGKGMKKKSVGYRLSGPCTNRDEMVKRAEKIVADLDAGWVPTKKSEVLKLSKNNE
jgi:hypothetical protein